MPLGDGVEHVSPRRVGKLVAGLVRDRLHRRRQCCDQRRQMAGQGGVVLERLDRRIDGAAAFMAKHQDERRIEHRDGIFQARDRIVVGEIAGDATDEQIAAAAVEGIFGRDAGIRAAQDAGIGILAAGQCLAFVLEIVPARDAVDIAGVALHQPLQRLVRRNRVLRLRRRLGILGKGPRRQGKACGDAARSGQEAPPRWSRR